MRAAIVLPAGFGVKTPAALMAAATRPVVDAALRPVAGDRDADGARTAHAARDEGARRDRWAAQAAPARGERIQPPFTTPGPSPPRRPPTARTTAMPTRFAGMGVQFILFMGIEVGVGVLLARRLGLWKRLRAAPLSRATLLGSHIAERRAHRADPARHHLRGGDRRSSRCASTAACAGFVGIADRLRAAHLELRPADRGDRQDAGGDPRPGDLRDRWCMVMLGGAWVPSFIFPAMAADRLAGRADALGGRRPRRA